MRPLSGDQGDDSGFSVDERRPRPSAGALTRVAQFLRQGGMIIFDTRDAGGAGSATQAGARLREILRPLNLPALTPVPEKVDVAIIGGGFTGLSAARTLAQRGTRVAVLITPVNDAPVIVSDGGGASAALSVVENTTAVTTVAATDVDAGQTLSYAIVGGADAAGFTIDPASGALAFAVAPDYDAPTDADGDNVYLVQVQVSDGNGGTDIQTLQVSVTNVDEAPVSAADSASRVEGGMTIYQADGVDHGHTLPIYDAAMKYIAAGVPTVIFAGEEYGTGSSRDWAAKGTQLLGIKAVVAKSFERIHRSNLVGMGVLPLQFRAGDSWQGLKLAGDETIDIVIDGPLAPQREATLVIHRADGKEQRVPLTLRIDTPIEVDYYEHGGILPYVLRQLL